MAASQLAASQPLISTLRAALRLAIGAGLAIALVIWSGRGHVLFLAVIAVVMFVSDNRSMPWKQLLPMVAAGLVGILTALVLFQLADGWLMLSVVLLLVALLVELLGLQPFRNLALLLAWGVLVMDTQRTFNIATVFNLTLSFVIGLLSARIVTALVWPDHPIRRIRALDDTLSRGLLQQVERLELWLQQGGVAPEPLTSAHLLPVVLDLQQLPAKQLGLLWVQVLRHWLLLEPLLLALPVPLSHAAAAPLLQRLHQIGMALSQPDAPSTPGLRVGRPRPWGASSSSALMALAIEQQLDTLDQVLHSQGLLRRSGRLQRLLS